MTPESQSAATSTPELPRGAMSGLRGKGARTPRILVVDDEQDVRSLIQDILDEQGYEVLGASGVAEASRLLRSQSFDTIIVDVFLDASDSGLGLLPLIGETQPLAPAIIISGMADMDVVIKALKAGAYDLLCKPFTVAEVQTAVANALEKKGLAEENGRLVEELCSERDNLERRVQEATSDLAAKVQTLHTVNQQLSTLFEMTHARSMPGSTQAVLDHILKLLGKILDFRGAFCTVFDLRAKEFNLVFSNTEHAEKICEAMVQGLAERHEALERRMNQEEDSESVETDLKSELLRFIPGACDSEHALLMPLYVPQTLIGAFGVVDIVQPTHLSEVEERILGFAISDFIAALQQRNFLNRTHQLANFGELTSEIAHDLRHPLTSLRGAAKILGARWDQEESRERCIKQISTDVTRMESLVSELLNFFKPNDLNMVAVEAHELLDKALEITASLAEESQIDVERCYEANPAMILGLSRNLIEALINLITNAIHSMGPGDKLTASSSCDLTDDERRTLREDDRIPENYIRLSIGDTGCGIAPDEIEKIFLRFYTTRKEGHGLGLSAVKRIVKKNLGAIRVESEIGKGSRFSIFLPKA